MFTQKTLFNSRISALIATVMLVFQFSLVHAVTFNPNVVITGSNAFDDSSSFNGSGGFSMISGTAPTDSTYDTGSLVSGAGNPLSGALTDIGDGFGFTGSASVTDDEFVIGFDAAINVFNNSSGKQTVTFRLNFNNTVNADGLDAYAQSNLFLNDGGFDDIFFSHLMSDTVNPDENGGVPIVPESFGAELTESGDLLFSFMLNPTESLDLLLRWELDGGDFSGGLATADLDAFLSVDRVVPLPGSFFLMASGMLLLPLQRLMRKNRGKS